MSHRDRRSSPRYKPADERAQIGWWDGKDFRTTPATLQDISTGGAALLLERGDSPATSVWMCVAGAGPTEWVQGTVSAAPTVDGRSLLVRLAFAHPCPYEIFKAAVWGKPDARPRGSGSEVVGQAAPATGLVAKVGSPLNDRQPVSPSPAPLPDDLSTRVVVASATTQVLPTLAEAGRSQRARMDRVAVLPWVLAFAMSLGVVALLVVVVAQRIAALRPVETLLSTPGR